MFELHRCIHLSDLGKRVLNLCISLCANFVSKRQKHKQILNFVNGTLAEVFRGKCTDVCNFEIGPENEMDKWMDG